MCVARCLYKLISKLRLADLLNVFEKLLMGVGVVEFSVVVTAPNRHRLGMGA
jgi:hypothetical protein